jgi:RNA polymerase sigma-70 factor (ECF subfamily)
MERGPVADPQPSDAELLAQLAARDAGALTVLYRRYAPLVYSLALRMLGNRQQAEDVVQDVFLKLWRQPQSYDATRGRFVSWLLGVTHHRAIDELRSRKRDHQHQLTEADQSDVAESSLLADLPDSGPELGDLAWLNVQRQAVRAALRALPPEQRRAVELAYFGGYTQSEIATALHQPLGTIKTRIRLGIQKLRALLEAQGITK